MKLTELIELYVTELNNVSSIKSDQTINGYISAVRKFYKDNSRIYRMTEDDIKKYMSHIRKEYSNSYYNVIGSAVKILFEKVLKQPRKMMWFSPVKTTKKFHNIISYSDFILMGQKCRNSKHKLILVLLYSTGIRRQELIDIKLKDIDFVNKRIFIKRAVKPIHRF